MKRDSFSPIAESVLVDNSTINCSDGENVQEVLEDYCGLLETALVTASPGFTWGSSGAIKNSYLQNDTVPSNKAGRLSTVTGTITAIFIVTELANDEYTLQIQRRVGNTFTTIASLVGNGTSRTYQNLTLNVPVTAGDELTAYIEKVGNKGATNPVCGLILTGTIA